MKNKIKNDNAKEHRAKRGQIIALRSAAIFLIIVFIISERAPPLSG